MPEITAEELARVNSFPRLVGLLRDKLDWPIHEDYEFEDVIFEYEPHELGLKAEETVCRAVTNPATGTPVFC